MRVSVQDRSAAEGAEDLRLMQLVAARDTRAQRVLAHRLAGRVRRIARRLLENRADADDASQMALIEILRSAGTFLGESSVERWASRITARTAIRLARESRRRSAAGIAPLLEVEALPHPSRTGGVQEEMPRKVDEYLARLSPRRREALVLKHVLGYTVEEIAEVTSTPPGTVKDRLIEARRQVRKMIQRDFAIGGRDQERK